MYQVMMSHHVGPRLGQVRSYALIERGLNQQAVAYAYVDDLRYIALVCFLCVPIVFFIRNAVAKKGAVAAAH
jgi:DHA2 family multidrug resistance protein